MGGNLSKSVGEFLVLIAFGAIVVALVRPGSQGPKLVDAIGTSTTGLVTAASGGGSWGR
jgi:hypothetical protein